MKNTSLRAGRSALALWLSCFVVVVLATACDEDADGTNTPQDTNATDTNQDTGTSGVTTDTSGVTTDPDTSGTTTADADATTNDDAGDDGDGVDPGPRDRVEVDLSAYTAGGTGDAVRLWVSTTQADLVAGPAAQGRVGDYVFESGKARVVIEQAGRVSAPCPYGGNVLDAGVKTADGWSEDILGEVCAFMNIGRTFYPERFEILQDGADGGAAVLAVTGRLEILDFIHVLGMAKVYVGDLIRGLPIDPDDETALSVTTYYIMRPGDSGVYVVTALRNDGTEDALLARGHLIHVGGDGQTFNPLSLTGGFGSLGLSIDNAQSQPLPFIAYRGKETSFLYGPAPELSPDDTERTGPLPEAGAYITISGVSVSLLGNQNLLEALLTPPASAATVAGAVNLKPGDVTEIKHWFLVGDGSLAPMVDVAYAAMDVDTGTISGIVRDGLGDVVDGAWVTALDAEGRPLNQARANEQGEYSMRVPGGDYVLRARLPGRAPTADVAVTVVNDQPVTGDVGIADAGRLTVEIRDPQGQAIPGRVIVFCEGACPGWPTNQEDDLITDALPGGAAASLFVGVEGEVSVDLAPGTYRVVVSRGLEWSVWPADAPQTRGQSVTIAANEPQTITAEIAQVVDTSGVLSGDLHVHAYGSPDSPVRNADRVKSFLAEGVDVIVSTDHDFIFDFAPVIQALGAQEILASVVGEEITTANYGHYNAFPLQRDTASINGGALDWGNDIDLGMTPDEIFSWAHSHPGQQVVQLNHAASGYINSLKADPLRRTTLAKPSTFRIHDTVTDPDGDTNLWSDRFTAMEIMNGYGEGKAWVLSRWWISMIARGAKVAGTAVSDTHKLRRDLGGGSRSFVFVGDGNDSVTGFDPSAYATAINNFKLIGSNGPFFRVEVLNDQGATASLGDTLTTNGQPVTLRVHLDLPAWMVADRVDVLMNLPMEVIDTEGASIDTPIPPTQTAVIPWEDADLSTVVTGNVAHQHRTRTVEFTLPGDADAYVVVIVRSESDNPGMFPIVLSGGVKPFAFSNPLFLDADGNGYDNFPQKDFFVPPPDIDQIQIQNPQTPQNNPSTPITRPWDTGFKDANITPRRMTHEDWIEVLHQVEHDHE